MTATTSTRNLAARFAGPVLAGRGLPGLARAGADVLGDPVAFFDRSGIVLAVAGATQDQESRLTEGGKGVTSIELALGDEVVGEVRYIGEGADAEILDVFAAFAALEVERARSAEWGNEGAVSEVVRGIMSGTLSGAEEISAASAELGTDLSRGGGVLMARAHSGSAQDGDWRSRVLDLTVTIARSRHVSDPESLERAGREAHLALNVGEAEGRSPIAFEETGAYRLLLGTGQDELMSFYSETVEPLVTYDEQYETDLVATVEAYLDSDGNVPATAGQMFTHRHTIRYRLERIRDLSGHDATATEGRERLSLGIKAMRVLGIASPRGRSGERKTGK